VNIRWLESGVDEAVSVQKIERRQNRGEHAAGFLSCERAARKELAEVFVGEFGDDVEAGRAVNRAAAKMKNLKQSRMRESGGGAPAIELNVGFRRILRDELDGGVGWRIAGTRRFGGGQKYGGVLSDAEKPAERETAVRELA